MNNRIGEKIRRRRLEFAWTQEYLAARVNVSRFAIISWENGKHSPDADDIQRLAEVLGVEPSYFFGADPAYFYEEETKKSFWERFKFMCDEQNIAPNAVAEQINVSSGAVTKWKNGTIPNTVALERIAKYFGVTTDYLLGREQPEAEEENPNGQFIENLKALITSAGISQKDFLSQMRLNINAIGDWRKNGNLPNYATLKKIAGYFGVTISELLGEEPTTREEETKMKPQAKPTIDEIIESMSEMGQVEWSYLRSAMDSKFTAPREVSDESRKQHEKKLERLFAFLCDSVERISEGKIAAPDETKILPDLIRILKHWDND